MATVNVFLYKAKILKNGESPIFIRITKDRRSKYISVGHNCAHNLWDFKKQTPKSKHPHVLLLSSRIEAKKKEIEKLVLILENEKGDFSLDTFLTKYERQSKSQTVFLFIDEIVKELVESSRIGNSEAYKSLKRVLVRFRDKKDFTFVDIDQSFLKKFEQDLRHRGLKETTMSYYFRTFRAVFNKAVEEGYAKDEENPFKGFKVSKFNLQTSKRAITREEIRKIEAINVGDNYMLELAKDVFLFSFYTSGISIIDIARLEDKNLKEGILSYIRSKTKQSIITKLLAPSMEIIDRYRNLRPGNYFFPILDKEVHTNEAKVKNRVKKVTRQINSKIKELANAAGIDSERMTTYVARHSFATTLKRNGVDIGKISEMLGHDSSKTTEIYLDSFESEQLYEASLTLL